MTKGNGKFSEKAVSPMDLEHELPARGSGPEDEPDTAETQSDAPAPSSQLEVEMEKLRAENRAYLDRLARLQAEFDNSRKRAVKEKQEFREYALSDALKQLLPILDSLDRALKTENAGADDFRSGIELIDRQFHDVLAKLGVEPVAAKGAPFDPNLHQAVQTIETSEVPDNHVVEELQRGYKLRDRLLRPAMVMVARNSGK
jgi:molecular chaperone GrpE